VRLLLSAVLVLCYALLTTVLGAAPTGPAASPGLSYQQLDAVQNIVWASGIVDNEFVNNVGTAMASLPAAAGYPAMVAVLQPTLGNVAVLNVANGSSIANLTLPWGNCGAPVSTPAGTPLLTASVARTTPLIIVGCENGIAAFNLSRATQTGVFAATQVFAMPSNKSTSFARVLTSPDQKIAWVDVLKNGVYSLSMAVRTSTGEVLWQQPFGNSLPALAVTPFFQGASPIAIVTGGVPNLFMVNMETALVLDSMTPAALSTLNASQATITVPADATEIELTTDGVPVLIWTWHQSVAVVVKKLPASEGWTFVSHKFLAMDYTIDAPLSGALVLPASLGAGLVTVVGREVSVWNVTGEGDFVVSSSIENVFANIAPSFNGSVAVRGLSAAVQGSSGATLVVSLSPPTEGPLMPTMLGITIAPTATAFALTAVAWNTTVLPDNRCGGLIYTLPSGRTLAPLCGSVLSNADFNTYASVVALVDTQTGEVATSLAAPASLGHAVPSLPPVLVSADDGITALFILPVVTGGVVACDATPSQVTALIDGQTNMRVRAIVALASGANGTAGDSDSVQLVALSCSSLVIGPPGSATSLSFDFTSSTVKRSSVQPTIDFASVRSSGSYVDPRDGSVKLFVSGKTSTTGRAGLSLYDASTMALLGSTSTSDDNGYLSVAPLPQPHVFFTATSSDVAYVTMTNFYRYALSWTSSKTGTALTITAADADDRQGFATVGASVQMVQLKVGSVDSPWGFRFADVPNAMGRDAIVTNFNLDNITINGTAVMAFCVVGQQFVALRRDNGSAMVQAWFMCAYGTAVATFDGQYYVLGYFPDEESGKNVVKMVRINPDDVAMSAYITLDGVSTAESNHFTISADGVAVVVSNDGTVVSVDVLRGRTLWARPGLAPDATTVSRSPDGRILHLAYSSMSAGMRVVVRGLNVFTGEDLYYLPMLSVNVVQVLRSPTASRPCVSIAADSGLTNAVIVYSCIPVTPVAVPSWFNRTSPAFEPTGISPLTMTPPTTTPAPGGSSPGTPAGRDIAIGVGVAAGCVVAAVAFVLILRRVRRPSRAAEYTSIDDQNHRGMVGGSQGGGSGVAYADVV
jgi:hypothetical protein